MTDEQLDVTVYSRQEGDAFEQQARAIAEYKARLEELAQSENVWTQQQQASELAMRSSIDSAQDAATAFDKTRESGLNLGEMFENLSGVIEGGVGGAIQFVTSGLGAMVTGMAAGAVIAVSLANEYGTVYNNLQNLNVVTGVSVGILGSLNDTQKVSGVTADQAGMAMERLGKNIESGSKNAHAGAEQLGLDWAELKNASPDQRFNMITEAVARLGPESDAAHAGVMNLLGRSGLGMLPAMSDEAIAYRESIHALTESIIGDEAEAAVGAKQWAETTNYVGVAFDGVKLRIGMAVADTVALAQKGAEFAAQETPGAGFLGTITKWSLALPGLAQAIALTAKEFEWLHSAREAFESGPAPDSKTAPKFQLDEGPKIDTPDPAAVAKELDKQIAGDKALTAAKKELNDVIAQSVGGLQGEIMKIEADTAAKVANVEEMKLEPPQRAALISVIKQHEQAQIDLATQKAHDTELTKANTEAAKDGAAMDKLFADSQKQLGESTAASLSPLDSKIEKINADRDATIDKANADFRAYQNAASLSGATDAQVESYRNETNATIENARATAENKTAHEQHLDGLKNEKEYETLLSQATLESDKATKKNTGSLQDSKDAIDEWLDAEAQKLADLYLDGKLTADQVTQIYAAKQATHDANIETAIDVSQKKAMKAELSDLKGLMTDFGISSNSALGQMVGDVEKGIDAFSKLSDMIKNAGSFLSGIGGLLSKIFGGGGSGGLTLGSMGIGGAGGAAGGGGLLGAVGGLGGLAAGLAAPLGLFALNSMLGTDPSKSEYVKAPDQFAGSGGYGPANYSGGGYLGGSMQVGVTAQQAAWNDANTPKRAMGEVSVPSDGIYGLHAGEMVLPPPLAAFVRGSASGPSGGGSDVSAQLSTAIAMIASLMDTIKNSETTIHVPVMLNERVLGDSIFRMSKDGTVRVASDAVVNK